MLTQFWRGNPEGKEKLGRPRCRWKDNIKIIFKNRMSWIGLMWLRIRGIGELL
jgi:truncated hemoglobin YjbI